MRQDVIPQNNATLSSYLNKIQTNFIEAYNRLLALETAVSTNRLIITGTEPYPVDDNVPEGTIYIQHE